MKGPLLSRKPAPVYATRAEYENAPLKPLDAIITAIVIGIAILGLFAGAYAVSKGMAIQL